MQRQLGPQGPRLAEILQPLAYRDPLRSGVERDCGEVDEDAFKQDVQVCGRTDRHAGLAGRIDRDQQRTGAAVQLFERCEVGGDGVGMQHPRPDVPAAFRVGAARGARQRRSAVRGGIEGLDAKAVEGPADQPPIEVLAFQGLVDERHPGRRVARREVVCQWNDAVVQFQPLKTWLDKRSPSINAAEKRPSRLLRQVVAHARSALSACRAPSGP